MESSVTGKWKTSFLLMCGIMALQETSLHVVAEVTYVDSSGNTHYLDGYEASNQFMSSVELIIGEKVKNTLSYALQYTKYEPGYFLTNVDTLSYSFLQLFHSVFVGDISFANLLFGLFTPEKGSFTNWLMTNINLPEEDVYKVVKILSEGSTVGFYPLPSILMKEIILMNTKYNYFRNACGRGDLPIIQWAINSDLSLNEFGLEGLKSAWDGKHWGIVRFLVGNIAFPLTNITYIPNLTNDQNETLLHYAVETDNSDYILSLLKADLKINAIDIFDKSPLQRAIEAYKTTAIYILIANGANINHETQLSDSLLHIATRIGNYEAVNLLLKEDFEINRKDGDGLTAFNVLERLGINIILNKLLGQCNVTDDKETIKKFEMHFTLNYGNICIFSRKGSGIVKGGNEIFLRNLTTIAKMLLKKDAQSDLKVEDKCTILSMAIDNKLSEGVHFLLETGIPALNISQALHRAVLNDEIMSIKYLLDAGAELTTKNSDGWKPIHTAASKGNLKVLKFLLEKGDDVNSKSHKDETVLHIAVFSDQIEIVNFLLQKGANIRSEDADGMQPIHVASLMGLPHIVQLLLANGSNPNARDSVNKTPLFHAALRGFENIARMLLDNGANVNARGRGGGIALHVAIWGGVKTVLLLLNRGAMINAKDGEETALYKASLNGITDVVKLLIQRGADTSLSDEIGYTPLHVASENGYIEVVKLLLDNGAEVDPRSNKRETPLHLASREGHYAVVSELLAKGAKVIVRNKRGESPIEAAHKREHHNVVDLLKENGAFVTWKS